MVVCDVIRTAIGILAKHTAPTSILARGSFSKFSECVIHQLLLDRETVDHLGEFGETGCGDVLRYSTHTDVAQRSTRRPEGRVSSVRTPQTQADGSEAGECQRPEMPRAVIPFRTITFGHAPNDTPLEASSGWRFSDDNCR
jgi:hypothetical protein